MDYVKILNEKTIEYAPEVKTTEAGTIVGYNRESNETMLLSDGYLKYTRESAPAPAGDSGYYEHGFVQDGQHCRDVYTWCTVEAPPPIPEVITPRCITKAGVINYLSTFKDESVTPPTFAVNEALAILKSTNIPNIDLTMWEYFNIHQYLVEDNEAFLAFAQMLESIRAKYGISIDTLLSACNDPVCQEQERQIRASQQNTVQ